MTTTLAIGLVATLPADVTVEDVTVALDALGVTLHAITTDVTDVGPASTPARYAEVEADRAATLAKLHGELAG